MWLPRLIHKQNYSLHLALSHWLLTLGEASHHVMRTFRQSWGKSKCKGTEAAPQLSSHVRERPWSRSAGPHPAFGWQKADETLWSRSAFPSCLQTPYSCNCDKQWLFLLWASRFGGNVVCKIGQWTTDVLSAKVPMFIKRQTEDIQNSTIHYSPDGKQPQSSSTVEQIKNYGIFIIYYKTRRMNYNNKQHNDSYKCVMRAISSKIQWFNAWKARKHRQTYSLRSQGGASLCGVGLEV